MSERWGTLMCEIRICVRGWTHTVFQRIALARDSVGPVPATAREEFGLSEGGFGVALERRIVMFVVITAEAVDAEEVF